MNKTKQEVLDANQWIVDKKLIELTWGNVSYYDDSSNLVYIKPSGIDLSTADPEVVCCLGIDGVIKSGLKPSVDTPTHIKIYENFDGVRSIVHTHSKYATIFSQAGYAIPCLGTTHADYFYGEIPCAPYPNELQVLENYEGYTGQMICDYFHKNKIDPLQMQACLVKGHGPFVWGKSINDALNNAYVLEIVAEFAYKTLQLNSNVVLSSNILDKHFLRKHGSNKYYGQ